MIIKVYVQECLTICLRDDNSPFHIFYLGMFLLKNRIGKTLCAWIEEYIEDNHKNESAMKTLFSAIAYMDNECKSIFLLKYYQKEKNLEILKCVMNKPIYSYYDVSIYYQLEIEWLIKLKDLFIKWEFVEQLFLIDRQIARCKEKIEKEKEEIIIEEIDEKILNNLKELDSAMNYSIMDIFNLYKENNDFRDMVASGFVSYKDGCIKKIDEKPLKFSDIIKDRKIFGIKVDTDENTEYESYLSEIKRIVNRFDKNKNMSLDDCLIIIFKDLGWSVKDFMEKTYLSRDVYSKINNNLKNKMEKKTLVQILIGIQVSKKEREFLLDINGTQLSFYNKEDVIYSFFLDSKMDIETASNLLSDINGNSF